ncbi:ABC transporter ATP-binding protein [Lampropedia puyangensis]|uniref:ABC transporter ATP-binding protein n=1 Tax=Lampropedia puyangensis TaxID=1330072 RepID=A0A4S8EWA2_9BURK|nr:ABC transporter ATP-binding protein [Lampropedia puyangensis]THT98094.1 ABC transporter ATP-binding protein [Lampropedia puyangensis]
MSKLLEVRDLRVRYRTRRGLLHAVDGVNLDLAVGETLGLVGESGCGKSSLAKAIMRLVEPEAGHIRLNGHDITHLKPARLRPYRKQFQMVFQNPSDSLDGRQRVGDLIAEPLALHRVGHRSERKQAVLALMEQVGLHASAYDRFPHEFSGGQRQRIAIARALALEPALIVCDEPVSALDVSLQAQILNLLSRLQQERGVSYLFVSHDLSVVKYLADRIAVMYLGQIVEYAIAAALWNAPAHPYTQALIAAVPQTDPHNHRIENKPILSGELPDPYAPPEGCRFHGRCPKAQAVCSTQAPKLERIAPGHQVACHFPTAVEQPQPVFLNLERPLTTH